MVDKKLTKEKAIEVFKKVEDPELNIDIWTLGLIYGFKIKKNDRTTTHNVHCSTRSRSALPRDDYF